MLKMRYQAWNIFTGSLCAICMLSWIWLNVNLFIFMTNWSLNAAFITEQLTDCRLTCWSSSCCPVPIAAHSQSERVSFPWLWPWLNSLTVLYWPWWLRCIMIHSFPSGMLNYVVASACCIVLLLIRHTGKCGITYLSMEL